MVAPERLRFDVSHPKAIEADELRDIEREVNARIRLNSPVDTRLMTPDEAIENGAMALFGEKYGDEVRVVTMGGGADHFSVELCGGTHVHRTGDIGFFHIVAESAVASGVRRIEALAGATADAYAVNREGLLVRTAQELKTTAEDVPSRVAGLLDERKKLEREISDLRRKLATGGGGANSAMAGGGEFTDIAGLKYAPRVLEGIPARELKAMADEIKRQIGSGVTAIVSVDDGKASIVVGVTQDVMDRISAVDLVRIGSAALGGKGGGGRPDMAQAGGPDGAAAQAALDAIGAAIGELAG
jgi:alanyl-tRNA synthetase